MKELKIRNFEIKPPKGSAFSYETPEHMPKLHQACLICGPRGSGKTTACVNLVERLPFDRIFCISPSMKSNKDLMCRLKIEEGDVYDDPDDTSCLAKIKASVEKERDDLEKYEADLKKYKALMKVIHSDSPLFRINDDELSQFYVNGEFRPPQHKYEGRKPCMALIIDDAQGSMLYSKPRAINQMTIYHRHLGQMEKGGALGLSLFFLVQSYKTTSGGITRAIRGNVTSMILFRNKNMKMLQEIADEIAGEVEPEKFFKIYERAMKDTHDFLFIDLHKKDSHPSAFRRNLDTFLVVDQ